MALEDEIVKWLDGMIKACADFRKVFDPADVKLTETPVVPQEEKTNNFLSNVVDSANDEFKALKEAMDSQKWPEAVNANLICDPNSEQDKNRKRSWNYRAND